MMRFIHYIKTYSSTNKKGRELNEFISKFEDVLIYDEIAFDALKQEVQTKVAELNTKYPKVKELVFTTKESQWSVKPIDTPDSYIFILDVAKVRSTYKFLEQVGIPQQMTFIGQEGGYQ